MAVTFGARVRECREARGLTQQTLAEQLGVSIGTVSHWETGRMPNSEQALLLADFFGKSLDWLFARDRKRGSL